MQPGLETTFSFIVVFKIFFFKNMYLFSSQSLLAESYFFVWIFHNLTNFLFLQILVVSIFYNYTIL